MAVKMKYDFEVCVSKGEINTSMFWDKIHYGTKPCKMHEALVEVNRCWVKHTKDQQ